MKRYALLTLLFTSLISCKAQTKIDPVSLESREKADIVLKSFDVENASAKLIYSLSDKDFLVILKNGDDYTEYYTSLNGNVVGEKRKLKIKKSNRQLIAQAFNLDQYHNDFITKMPDAKYVRGNKSYFAVIDNKGRKYGEYSLAALTLPLPINGDLAGYLMRTLTEETSKQ